MGFQRGFASKSLGAFRGCNEEGGRGCGAVPGGRVAWCAKGWLVSIPPRSMSVTGIRLSGNVDPVLPSEGCRVASGSALSVGGRIGLMSPGFGRTGLDTLGANPGLDAAAVDGNGIVAGAVIGVACDMTVGGPIGTTDVAPGIEGALAVVQIPLGHGVNEVVGAVAGTV